MNATAHKFLFLFLLLLGGCWDDPIGYAWDESNNTPETEIPNDLNEAYNEVTKQIYFSHYSIKDDHNCPEGGLRAHTNQKRKTVFLCDAYYDESFDVQVGMLYHELVHIRQAPDVFTNPNFQSKEWTWAYEVQAFRQSLILHNKFREPVTSVVIIRYVYIVGNYINDDKPLMNEARDIFESFFADSDETDHEHK